jgi:hypothetical protein
MQSRKPLVYGLAASLALLLIYILVLSIANSFSHALIQFLDLWYWMTPLIVGFGFQVGLYTHIRQATQATRVFGTAKSSLTAAGGVSTTSMVACCAHHVTDVIPVLGISAAAIFLNQYQTLFLAIGVLSNLVGINLMLKIIQEHNLHSNKNTLMKNLMGLSMKKTLYGTTSLSVAVILVLLFNSW